MPEENERRGIDPRTVRSPRRSIQDLNVIHDGGRTIDGDPWTGWSLARLTWEEDPNAVGCRWNGEVGVNPGNPSSRGFPTWFIIPSPFAEKLVEIVQNRPSNGGQSSRLRRSVSELLTAARAATSEEVEQLQI